MPSSFILHDGNPYNNNIQFVSRALNVINEKLETRKRMMERAQQELQLSAAGSQDELSLKTAVDIETLRPQIFKFTETAKKYKYKLGELLEQADTYQTQNRMLSDELQGKQDALDVLADRIARGEVLLAKWKKFLENYNTEGDAEEQTQLMALRADSESIMQNIKNMESKKREAAGKIEFVKTP